jgi:hypothetical protein
MKGVGKRIKEHKVEEKEAEVGGLWFKVSPGKKLARPFLKNKPGVVVHAMIPTTLETEVRGSWSNASLGKSMRHI